VCGGGQERHADESAGGRALTDEQQVQAPSDRTGHDMTGQDGGRHCSRRPAADRSEGVDVIDAFMFA